MNKPYIFGHRGASGYYIENTVHSFKKAVEMGAGIETDICMTKDEKLICFHDLKFQIGLKWYILSTLTLNQLKNLKFEDNREILTIEELFKILSINKSDIRYSFDIQNRKVGIKLLNFLKDKPFFHKVEITDKRLIVLSLLRKHSDKIKLVYTLPTNLLQKAIKTLNIDKLKSNEIDTLNIKYVRNIEEIIKFVIDNGFNLYVWGVNSNIAMKKVLKLHFKGKRVDAIYTDYPDRLLKLIEQDYKKQI